MKISNQLTLAVISDIHLGHARNKAAEIIRALNLAFPDNDETGKIDLLVLAGDVFDRLLNLPDDDVGSIQEWIAGLLQLCAKRKITLRVLEGTPSHDWKQSNLFERIYSYLKLDFDFKYVDTLSIEYLPKFDINVLYVPDEWEVTTDKTLEQVKGLLSARGLEQVDYAFMHGQFEYQLPAHIKKIPRHDSSEYLKIVKHYIFIGHVHTYSTYDRIIAQGSFDRLSHGEEGPKGHVRAIITSDAREHFFIENKEARIYKTLKCKDMDLQKTLEYIRKAASKVPSLACVRIQAESTHPIFTNMNQLVTMYPTVVWSKDPKKAEEAEVIQEEETPKHHSIAINRDNIVTLVMDRVKKNNSDPEILKRSEEILVTAL